MIQSKQNDPRSLTENRHSATVSIGGIPVFN